VVRTVATLPETERKAFKEPLGPIFTEADDLLADAGEPIIAVGDVVTYHLVRAGVTPHLTLVDGLTERQAVAEEIGRGMPAVDRVETVESAAGTISAPLVEALVAGLDRDEPTLVRVDGEEDLATLPAILVAPDGASVVYGHPGQGMARVDVTPEVREQVRVLCGRLDTEPRFWDLVGLDAPG